MEILYISSVPSPQEFYRMKKIVKEGIDRTIYGMSEAGFKFHSLIIDGMKSDSDVRILSLVGRSINAKTHKGFFWKKRVEQSDKTLCYKHLSVLNIPFLKQLFLGISFFFNTINWLIKNKKEPEKYIIMDASYITVIPFVLLATKIISCKTAAIFCDIYSYMADVKDAREHASLLHRMLSKFMRKMYTKLDSMVLLTEQMNSAINISSKPYVIIEGLVDINMTESKNEIENKSQNNIILYAGALRAQYGLKNLIEGFLQYQDENARLWIYGAGDYSDTIKEATQKDSRIEFFGQAPLDQVIQKEIEADLLINPRPADLEFTQYSFPSKNMEYMVSGTPLLTTKLPGMPTEYYDYVYTIDGSTPEDITAALQRCFSCSKKDLHEKGKLSKQFVLSNKNNNIQARKILNLIRGSE